MRKGIIGAGNWILDKVKIIDRWPGEGNLCNIIKDPRHRRRPRQRAF